MMREISSNVKVTCCSYQDEYEQSLNNVLNDYEKTLTNEVFFVTDHNFILMMRQTKSEMK